MKTRAGILILLITMVCTLAIAAPALASPKLNKYERQLLSEVNKRRAAHGLSQLRVNAKLVRAARSHSTDMGARKYLEHDTPAPNAESWSARIIRYGYTKKGCSHWKAGETIALGKDLYSSPVFVVDSWMKSRVHRAVILTKAFRDVGVGAVKTGDGYGSLDGTVWFFTLDFGRRIMQ